MKDFIDWVIENKEWVFSGIGVAIITLILGFLFKKESVRNNLKAMFNFKSNITQINIENKEAEKE